MSVDVRTAGGMREAPADDMPSEVSAVWSLPRVQGAPLFLRDKKGAQHFLVTAPAQRLVDLNALGEAPGVGL